MLKTKLFLTFCLFFALPTTKVTAQLTPDSTLGIESSVVSPVDELNDKIRGGAARRGNLFHSFTEFNVGEGRGVDFVNPASIDNIITRVTGSNVSNIFGKLGVLGGANLFLINPNGIIFGEGARLDIGGSFYGSTADSVLFPDNVEFSATNPQRPLLTINRPIGLVLGNNPGTIINRSKLVETEITNEGYERDIRAGLKVNKGNDFALIGGDIFIDHSAITAPGGRVTLGGLSQAGDVTFNPDGSLVFPENIEKVDVFLEGIPYAFESIRNSINVVSDGGGAININARNLTLIAVDLLSGITQSNNMEAVSGDIDLNADSISLNNFSSISSKIYQEGKGRIGDINLNANSISLNSGSEISSSIYQKREGRIGDINLNANSISLDNFSSISSKIYQEGKGVIGDINLEANSISLNDSSTIRSSIYHKGKGEIGDINLNANSILFNDRTNIIRTPNSISFSPSYITSSISFQGQGTLGSINLNADSIFFNNWSYITLSIHNQGKGTVGNISLNADSISFDDRSSILSNIYQEGKGIVGDINLNADSVFFRNSGISARIGLGEGLIGDINFNANSIFFHESYIILNIEGASRQFYSYIDISSIKSQNYEVIIGDINFNADSIYFDNNSQISSRIDNDLPVNSPDDFTFTVIGFELKGKTGNINLNADYISFDNSSRILSGIENKGEGTVGDINLNASSLFVNNASDIVSTTNTETDQKAANININATNLVEVTGLNSTISSETGGTGDAGNIVITTQELKLSDGGQISANNFIISFYEGGSSGRLIRRILDEPQFGIGSAGKIYITSSNLKLENQAGITAFSRTGKGGNITLTVEELLSLANNSEISTTAGIEDTPGDGGNIDIDAGFIFAMPGENSDITANAFSGSGGQININAVGIFNLEPREEETPGNDITAFSQTKPNLNGQITINTLEIEPSRQLFLLPTQPLNSQIAQTCTPGTKEARSEFIISGRGGIAPNTLETLQLNPTTPDWVEFPQSENASQPKSSNSHHSPSAKIIEAQGWVRDKNGEVILVADVSAVTPHDSWQKPRQCTHN